MSYRDLVGNAQLRTKDEKINSGMYQSSELYTDHEYEKVRFGLPEKAINFSKVKHDYDLCVNHFIEHGYKPLNYKDFKNNDFRRHIATFKTNLDLWEAIDFPKSMNKEEIYWRSLTERASFTEFVKKARSTTVRYITSETNTAIEEEYLLRNYAGYDSMIHERYLLNWDISDETDDIKYSFMEQKPINEKEFEKRVDKLFQDFRISEEDFSEELDMLKQIKNSVMYNPLTEKSQLIRDFWDLDVSHHGSYYAKRRVIPIESGNVRDTGVGDPGTILKVKVLNLLARTISEKLPYCANAPMISVENRLRRVLKKNGFLHVDFKKFGLTFPRQLMNIVIRKISEYSGIDLSSLIINKFVIDIDGDCYETSSGTVLGWLDSINCIAVCAILHYLSCEKELRFDFITFNDDIEISKNCRNDIPGSLELLRMAVIAELNYFSIPISLDKTYGSRSSIFLEKYNHFGHYGLDMTKRGLCIKQYTTSIVSLFKWQAKLYHAIGNQTFEFPYATDRCIYTIQPEFRPEEASMSLWSGGWFIRINDKRLDDSFIECDGKGLQLGIELSKFKPNKYTVGLSNKSDQSKLQNEIEKRSYEAYSSQSGKSRFKDASTLLEINEDIEIIRQTFEQSVFNYEGKDKDFALRVSWTVGTALGPDDHG